MKKVQSLGAALIVALMIGLMPHAAHAGASGRKTTAAVIGAVAGYFFQSNAEKARSRRERDERYYRRDRRNRDYHDDRNCRPTGYFRDDRDRDNRNRDDRYYRDSRYDPEHPPLYGGGYTRGTVIYDPVANRYPDGHDDRDR